MTDDMIERGLFEDGTKWTCRSLWLIPINLGLRLVWLLLYIAIIFVYSF